MTRVYRAASAVIANSANTQSLIVGLGLPAERVPVVHPGVDPTRFRPGVDGRSIRQALLRGGDTVLLSVGRLQLRKGHDLVIEAVAALRDRLPGLRYAIAGDGEERGRLETLASARGVADAVTFMGPVPADDLPACYAACDIFVMPNRQEGADIEGFGIVFLEAAAAERPAIGGRSGGAPEAIEAGLTGLLVGGTDPQELAAVIERLAGDPGLRAALGRAGRERVVNGFTWDHAAARVAAIHAAAGGE
jgi:phosphatidylinositol alpha-1,6-mannosyltransferase